MFTDEADYSTGAARNMVANRTGELNANDTVPQVLPQAGCVLAPLDRERGGLQRRRV